SRRRHTRFSRDWSSDVCSSDLGASGTPAYEIGEELQAGRLAFFGMELDRENVIAGHRAGKGRAVPADSGRERGVPRRGIVAVHEIGRASSRERVSVAVGLANSE